jgi:hypothetical protein
MKNYPKPLTKQINSRIIRKKIIQESILLSIHPIHNKKTHELSLSYIHINRGQIFYSSDPQEGGEGGGELLYFHADVSSRKFHHFVVESY